MPALGRGGGAGERRGRQTGMNYTVPLKACFPEYVVNALVNHAEDKLGLSRQISCEWMEASIVRFVFMMARVLPWLSPPPPAPNSPNLSLAWTTNLNLNPASGP